MAKNFASSHRNTFYTSSPYTQAILPLLLVVATTLNAQTGESDLPGRPRKKVAKVPAPPAPNVEPKEDPKPTKPAQPKTKVADGASESDLPGKPRAKQSDKKDPETADPKSPRESTTPDRKPDPNDAASESRLPEQKKAGDEKPAIEQQRPKGRPWLRLDMRGHAGVVRSFRFTEGSNQICSVGDDKQMHLWSKNDAQIRQRTKKGWRYQNTVRWQVQRGPAGELYGLDYGFGMAAMAGYGASGAQGEIWLVDPLKGRFIQSLVDKQNGHKQLVYQISMAHQSPDPALVSIDTSGKSLFWKRDRNTGLWKATVLTDSDKQVFGAALAKRLESARRIVCVSANGNRVILPVFDRAATNNRNLNPEGRIVWRLEQHDIAANRRSLLPAGSVFKGHHARSVSALATSRDGRYVVSGALNGKMFIWDLNNNKGPARVDLPGYPESMSFSHDGSRVLVGTMNGYALVYATNQLLTAQGQAPRPLSSYQYPDRVRCVRSSPDGKSTAVAFRNQINLFRGVSVAPGDFVEPLRASIKTPAYVTFAVEKPFYRVAVGYDTSKGIKLQAAFDPTNNRLFNTPVENEKWMPQHWGLTNWRIEEVEPQKFVLLYDGPGDKRSHTLPVKYAFHDSPSTFTIIIDRKSKPYAVAYATRYQNMIHIAKLPDNNTGKATLIRQFRGHSSDVNSLAVSRDLEYMASTSFDGTVRFWPIGNYNTETSLNNRWGAGFQIDGNRLTVSSILKAGPLFFRGMRANDQITKIKYTFDGVNIVEKTNPADIVEALQSVPWETLVTFEYKRNNAADKFQIFPAWNQISSLFIAADREWAYWSPTGYYDASFGGHKLFGWQFNRGHDRAPEYFDAGQLRKALERPEVMRRLLRSGSIVDAYQQAEAQQLIKPHQVIAEQYQLKPQIEILSPEQGTVVKKAYVKVQARITTLPGQRLSRVKAFANGVVSAKAERLERVVTDTGVAHLYEFSMRLPRESDLLLQVAAATDDEVADIESLEIKQDISSRPTGRNKLKVIAAGVNTYYDSQIASLNYATKNATKVVEALQQSSSQLYELDPVLLLNDNANRSSWRFAAQEMADQLKSEVSPDDVLLIFLSGHGVQDPKTGEYYFVTANTRYEDVMAGRYSSCLSFSDFSRFGEVPCRKIVVLDTCHSGAAMQELTQDNLKPALRALQDDMMFTFTASEGSEEAVESREKELGRFTYHLIQALSGRAKVDTDGDKVASLPEIVAHVRDRVFEDSQQDNAHQHPTAGPRELLERTNLPISFPGN